MYDNLPLPDPGGSCTTKSSSDVRITYKLNIHLETFPPTTYSIPTKTTNQYRPPSLSAILTHQVGQVVTHIDSNGTCVTAMIAKVMMCSISSDPISLIEVIPKQTCLAKIASLHEPYDPNIFSSTAPFGLSIPTQPPKNCDKCWLWSPLTYPCNHLCLPRLPCIPSSSILVSTSHHWSSNHIIQHHY